MNDQDWRVRSVPVPRESAVCGTYPKTDLADAFAVRLPEGSSSDPEVLARFLLSQQAGWVDGLMRVRDAMVTPFGIKTSTQLKATPPPSGRTSERVGLFRIFSKSPNEIVLGENDRHLDFRVGVLLERRMQVANAAASPARYLVVSTVVHCNNLVGHAYIALITVFHRLVVRSMLRRAARAGWPRAQAA